MKAEMTGNVSPCGVPVAGGQSTAVEGKRRAAQLKLEQQELMESGESVPLGISRGPKGWTPWQKKLRKRQANLGLVGVMAEALQALGAPVELLECFHDATLHRIKTKELRAKARAILSAVSRENGDAQ